MNQVVSQKELLQNEKALFEQAQQAFNQKIADVVCSFLSFCANWFVQIDIFGCLCVFLGNRHVTRCEAVRRIVARKT